MAIRAPDGANKQLLFRRLYWCYLAIEDANSILVDAITNVLQSWCQGSRQKNGIFQGLVLNNGGQGVLCFFVFLGNHFLYQKHPQML